MADFAPWNEVQARTIIAGHAGQEGAALPILHDLQAAFGCVPLDAEPMIATALNLTRAEVHGIVSFYHDFRRKPPGHHVVRICRAEACQSVGGDQVGEAVRKALSVGWHETTPDGSVTLEPVFCLGLCASGPSALVDGKPLGHLTPDSMKAALNAATAPAPTGATTDAPHTAAAQRSAPSPRVFVPRDAAALAVGADAVAEALAPHAHVVRTGSRGL
ncbi:MAG TPA: formate dehydrogenase subunit gamma, partial [Rhodopila sp.]|nr:formate dehydrogenase subunit gamma [Rhodopila sp.]